ncbi:MAG TPA: hypothetical protein VIE12_04370 [Actinomycetota bacterium]|jgi:hypothetical protein
MRTRTKVAVMALAATMILAAAPAAHAGGPEVIRRGSCSAGSDWKLKVKPDDGRLELEFEVDPNVVGQTWNVAIRQDGDRIFSGSRVTQGPSGSFELRRRPADTAGTDRFVARATNPSTGETCVGRATL